MASLARWLVLLLTVAFFGCADSHGDDDDDDDDADAGQDAGADVDAGGDQCDDTDGDGYGVGAGCDGDDCDEGNPDRHEGCGENCAEQPEGVGCPCANDDEVVSCFDGEPDQVRVGICLPGLRTCTDSVWGSCDDQVLPREEDAQGRNELDDDCNGLVDDLLCGDETDCGGDCCEEGEVCLGNHCDVAGDCAVDGNCDDDTHCSADGCIPYRDGETNLACDGDIIEPVPPLEAFEPVVQCHYGAARDGTTVPPIVIDLDQSVDGVIEPEIIFTGSDVVHADVQVTALSGTDCTERFRTNAPGLAPYAPVAAGDLDNDGSVEIVAVGQADGIVVFDSNGEELWRADTGLGLPSFCLTPVIANLDGVGDAEIVLGTRAYDTSGEVIWNVGAPALASWGIVPVVADVDLDGQLEVITGNRIIDGATGEEEQFFAELADGNAAIADFDQATPEPEIVVVASTGVRIQRITGEVIFGPNDALVGNPHYGGPPAVADFDGDGFPEIGSAGPAAYVVLDPDCEPNAARGGDCPSGRLDGVLWSKTTQDPSSGSTGSSVFDFDFDGTNEVIYNDECFLRVYDGLTGDVRFIISNSSTTAYEYPVIADVDGDGQTEIVVAANSWRQSCGTDDPETGQPFDGYNDGITVWRDVQDRWAPSRRIWNQHAYSVTNVEENGHIPAVPENNWSIVGLNNFRVNTRNDPASATRGVDLTARAPAWDDGCPERITLSAIVANRGIRTAPRGVSVGFYLPAVGDEPETLLCQTRTVGDIQPGVTETVGCDWVEPDVDHVNIHVRVDDTDALVECEEDNNDATITDVGCEEIG